MRKKKGFDADRIIKSFIRKSTRDEKYRLFITRRYGFCGERGEKERCDGLAYYDLGYFVSSWGLRQQNGSIASQLELLMYHETGHVFNVSGKDEDGMHCDDLQCIMNLSDGDLIASENMNRFMRMRKKKQIFCRSCVDGIKNYFDDA